jgi:hypothetical protein
MGALPVVIGYEVVRVEKTAAGERVKRISPRAYTVKAAAEEFFRLAQAGGIDCYVREVLGVDRFGGMR